MIRHVLLDSGLRSGRNFDLLGTVNLLDNRLVFAVVDALDGAEDHKLVLCGLVFLDRLVTRIVVLLVRKKDVLQQRTLTRQEAA